MIGLIRAALAAIKPHARSSKWAAVRKAFLAANPTCAACGSRDKLNVHHVEPFHLDPGRELDPANLLTLCEGAGNCHLVFGHLHNWSSHNPSVREDAAAYLAKVRTRP